jgi:LysM repeat protein/DNA-binding SARP family transcriptional activator
LTSLVVGIPVLLVLVSPVRSLALPSWSGISDALTGPDDGQLFLTALAVVAWLAWAAFTVSVAVEAVAVARGLPSPRLPLLRVPQRAASTLVAAAAVVLTVQPLPTSPATVHEVPEAFLTSTHAAPGGGEPIPRVLRSPNGVSLGAQAETVLSASSSPTALAARARTTPHGTVTVRRGDTLWGLAEQHLGAGSRYREIAKLNYGRAQPDGRTLTDAHWVYPGWVLQLPPDATGVRQGVVHEPAAGNELAPVVESNYTVRPGDTLWGIAEQHVGDPRRYREIYQLNAGRTQDVGGHLADPDVLIPGWVLRLPASDSAAQTTQPQPGPKSPVFPPTSDPAVPHRPERPTVQPSPPSAGADEPADSIDASTSADDLDNSSFPLNQLALGMTVLASAGLIAELARRRRHEQRLRQPGERIALPDRGAAIAEQQLHAAQDPVTVETLRTAFGALAINCRTNGTDLPRVMAVKISSAHLELLTDDPGDAVDPFVSVGNGTWRLDRSQPTDGRNDGDLPDPYPALVTVGVTDDAVVLLNLEAAGVLTVAGEDHIASEVIRALAVELATSSITGGTTLVLAESLTELADVSDASRVQCASEQEVAHRAPARTTNVAAILAESGAIDLHDARSRGMAHDTWAPEIFVASAPIDAAPWSGIAVIDTGEGAKGGWNLKVDSDGRGRLDPLSINLDLPRLNIDDYCALIKLLRSGDVGYETSASRPDSDQQEDASKVATTQNLAQLVLTALPAPPEGVSGDGGTPFDGGQAPRVNVLGRVQIGGALKGASSNRRARATEFLAYLALHPGASAHEIDEAIWPGRRVAKEMRNSFVSRVRHWLGSDPDGQPFLPLVGDHGDYRLSAEVSCDWHDFLRFAREGLASGPVGADLLARALSLVRARPFLGIDPTTYNWAEADTQEMVSAVVDVAHVLSVLQLGRGDARAAQDAAARGLLVEPGSEILHCDAIRAAAARGDSEEIARLSARLRAQIELVDPDGGVGEATSELLRELSVSQT